MRISIALATYQGARFLPRQLQSFLDQARLPDELCISDDGSTDGTLELLRDFAAPFAVRIVSNPTPGGATRNFERALGLCTGDVVLYSDQDDVWLPNHIERLLAPLEADPRIVAVASNSTYVDVNLEPTGVDTEHAERFPAGLRNATMRLSSNQFELVLRHRISAGHGMAFRRSLVPLLVPFSNLWFHDQWVFLLAAAAGFVTYVQEPLTLHRQHDRQDVGNRRLDLTEWAAKSMNRPQDQERLDAEKWRELLARIRQCGDLLRDPQLVQMALEQKLNFVIRRAQARRSAFPRRFAFTTRELLRGRYHRWGRGLLTYARDLYGARGQAASQKF